MRKTQLLWNFRFCMLFCLIATPATAQEASVEVDVLHQQGERPRWGGERGGDRSGRWSRGEGGRFEGGRPDFSRGEGGGGMGGRFRGPGPRGPEHFQGEGQTQQAVETPVKPGETGTTPAKKVQSTAKVRVTVDLAAEYQSLDLDQDGQIAFHEWRKAKRGDLAGFQALDHNGDGFLTPSEIQRGTKVGIASTRTADPSAATLNSSQTSDNTSVASNSNTNSMPQTETVSTSAPAKSVSTAKAKTAEVRFSNMDSNRDGQISPEEWKRSTRIAGAFTKAGVDLTTPTSKEAFVENYIKHYPD